MAHFELCAESLEAALAGARAGADRLELCQDLAVSGLTPAPEVLEAVLRAVRLPVHVLIRPRAGNFVYTDTELAEMRRQIQTARQAGAAGVALGVLRANGSVDVERTRELIESAQPMHTTFHRAFDETRDLKEALEAVISTGARTLLTSGGAPDCLGGAERISELLRQAAGRISVMVGAGLTLANLEDVARRTGAEWLHGSLSRRGAGNGAGLEADVRQAVELLQRIGG